VYLTGIIQKLKTKTNRFYLVVPKLLRREWHKPIFSNCNNMNTKCSILYEDKRYDFGKNITDILWQLREFILMLFQFILRRWKRFKENRKQRISLVFTWTASSCEWSNNQSRVIYKEELSETIQENKNLLR